MKESIWGYMIIVLGVLAIGVIWFMANVTRTDQHNFYLLRETVEASMLDAVDLSIYRETGEIEINETMFIESFLRRFANNADLSNTYVIEIYDISTKPPKVSMRISSATTNSSTGEIIEFDMINNIDAILETTYTIK